VRLAPAAATWLWFALAAALATGCRDAPRRAGQPAPTASPPATPQAPGPLPLPPHRTLPTARAALEAILSETRPRVLGFGEYHQKTGATARSALSLFDRELFATLAPRVSDVVVETWLLEGRCGAAREERVNAEVQTATQRPAGTEDEVGALLRLTREAGAQPHVMTLRCSDYASLTPDGGEVDYEALLDLVTRELTRVTESILRARTAVGPRDLVVVYGGSMHNDLHPYPGVEGWSYAPRIDDAAAGRYVEVDLYVPEYVTGNPLLEKEAWYPLLAGASSDAVTLIERAPRSYIVILPRSP
jgi:hypothetical protein